MWGCLFHSDLISQQNNSNTFSNKISDQFSKQWSSHKTHYSSHENFFRDPLWFRPVKQGKNPIGFADGIFAFRPMFYYGQRSKCADLLNSYFRVYIISNVLIYSKRLLCVLKKKFGTPAHHESDENAVCRFSTPLPKKSELQIRYHSICPVLPTK